MRSHIHMLMVAAARVEQDHGNPKLVADLREAAKVEGRRTVEGRSYHPEDEKRIGRQRTLMAMVAPTQAKDDLLAAMVQRAYDLMWNGDCLASDAIVEFLPSALAEKMFAAWMDDQDGKKPRSAFYHGKGLAA